ncbi:MAG: hypothetical protein ABI596_12310 [Pyrinomonadaceae bacterium]
MKNNVLSQPGNRFWFSLLCATALAAFTVTSLPGPIPTQSAPGSAVPPAQPAAMHPWTAVGSTGAVDEASLSLYAFGTSEIGFKRGAFGSVVARYNVTNTFDNNAAPNKPGWRTLEMGSVAPINTIIEAKLFTIKACSTDPVLLCTARNRSMDNPCARCTINATIDFTDSLYFVEVTLSRPNANTTSPRMFTLRVF